jgi:pimeloyl-ACP methyl ester carboxylesterase
VTAAPESGWLDVPAGRLYYERAGRGPPIVFVHAAIADRRMWDREFSLYADRRTVVRYDLRGLGRSEPTTGPFRYSEDLERLLEHLRLGASTLVGASLGGRTALDLALEHPASVRSLLLAAPAVSGFDPSLAPEGTHAFEQDNVRFTEILQAWNDGRTDEALERLRVYWCSQTQGPNRELVRTMMRENADEIFLGGTESRAEDPPQPAARRLRLLRVPTVVLTGDHDEPSMGYVARYVAKSIIGARLLTLKAADHLPNLSRPREFDAALVDVMQ